MKGSSEIREQVLVLCYFQPNLNWRTFAYVSSRHEDCSSIVQDQVSLDVFKLEIFTHQDTNDEITIAHCAYIYFLKNIFSHVLLLFQRLFVNTTSSSHCNISVLLDSPNTSLLKVDSIPTDFRYPKDHSVRN